MESRVDRTESRDGPAGVEQQFDEYLCRLEEEHKDGEEPALRVVLPTQQ